MALVIVLLLAAAVLLGRNLFATPQTPNQRVAQAPVEKFSFVRATTAIPKGRAVAPDKLALTETTKPPAQGTFTRLSDLNGRVAAREIAANDPLSQSNTSLPSKPASLADVIPPGMRAISLHVSEDSAVANLIRPGDHIDVLVISAANRIARQPSELFPSAEAKTLLQDVPVLAVDQQMDRSAAPARNGRDVTLAVRPEDAAAVALIRSIGAEYLVLRSTGDQATTSTATVTTENLGLRTTAVTPKAPSHRGTADRTIEIIRGPSRLANDRPGRSSP